MAETIKRLGSSRPANTDETTLYTVPGSTSTVVSSIFVCNQDSSARTFRVSITSGGAPSAGDYLYYDVSIPANDTFVVTAGFTLATGYIISVKASVADLLSFNAFGTEIS